jgi:hypothetical protein
MMKKTKRWWDLLPAAERKLLQGTGSELKLLEPAVLDNAIVGYGRLLSDPNWFVIYSYHALLKALKKTWASGPAVGEAETSDADIDLDITDHIQFNIAGCWVGPSTWMLAEHKVLSKADVMACVFGSGQRCGQPTSRIYDIEAVHRYLTKAKQSTTVADITDGLQDKRKSVAIIVARSIADMKRHKPDPLPTQMQAFFQKVP